MDKNEPEPGALLQGEGNKNIRLLVIAKERKHQKMHLRQLVWDLVNERNWR